MKDGRKLKRKHRQAHRQRRVVWQAFCVALVLMLLGLAAYILRWYLDLGRIRTESERYASLYVRSGTPHPTETDALPSDRSTRSATDTDTTPRPSGPSPVPAAGTGTGAHASRSASPVPSSPASADETSRTPAPTALPITSVPASPVASEAPRAEASASATVSRAPSPVSGKPALEDMPVVQDAPIPTPDDNTLVIALPTAPPVQDSFTALLDANPETVAFLEIENMLSLPVVQRENDNEYYLDHNYENLPAQEGTLFLDGMNRLVPEDDCLIVYGHNMKNHTMFGRLSAYADIDHLRRHPVVRFDTLYEDRSYAVFAAFSASMLPGNARYFDVRQFIFDETEFDKFVLKLQSRSVYRVPLDVRYGDRLLLLVTCDYSNREGRFILALRQLREDERDADIWAAAMQATTVERTRQK